MRKHIVAGNWKMNKTFEEADELSQTERGEGGFGSTGRK